MKFKKKKLQIFFNSLFWLMICLHRVLTYEDFVDVVELFADKELDNNDLTILY